MRGIAGVVALVGVLIAAAPASAGDSEWVRQSLAHQYELGSKVPLRDAPWVGTHNSFNSSDEMGASISAQDSNQRITIVEQLDAGVRSLELDVHLFPRLSGTEPVVCHAAEFHVGCSTEKSLAQVLGEIRGWLRSHRNQVLLLYLEDHLDNEAGYDEAAAVVEEQIGDVVWHPPGRGASCRALPLDSTRADARRAGDQVIIVSSCGQGRAWKSVAFDWDRVHEESRPRAFQEFPRCGPDFTRRDYETKLIRYFEDSTRLTATASVGGAASRDDGLTPDTVEAMTWCGVDLFGLDQVTRDDLRFERMVWSWAPDEPRRRPGCAVQREGRWFSTRCKRRLRVACRTSSGAWRVPRRVASFSRAARLCRRARMRWAVPRTGHEAQLLRLAMERGRVARAWVRYRAR